MRKPDPSSKGVDRTRVYDVLGRQVRTLVERQHEPGREAVRLNATGLSPGPYFVRMRAGSSVQTTRLTVVE